MNLPRKNSATIQGVIQKKFIDAYTQDKLIWSFVLNVHLNGHRHNLAQASYFEIGSDLATSFINERTALHSIKTTAISLNAELLNLDQWEPRCHACTSPVLSEEVEGEFLCLNCGEVGPREWFFAEGQSDE